MCLMMYLRGPCAHARTEKQSSHAVFTLLCFKKFLYFFFSGPRLYPGLSVGSLIGSFVVVLLVTCISALYPAVMATRVQPIQAMASED